MKGQFLWKSFYQKPFPFPYPVTRSPNLYWKLFSFSVKLMRIILTLVWNYFLYFNYNRFLILFSWSGFPLIPFDDQQPSCEGIFFFVVALVFSLRRKPSSKTCWIGWLRKEEGGGGPSKTLSPAVQSRMKRIYKLRVKFTIRFVRQINTNVST